ncbi:MAG: acyl-CoA thioesterase domain-containing protein, partial [Rhodococcus sp. (in: high G+C Gram-positive bacteria)]
DLRPTRATFDLLRPVRMQPICLECRVVREGPRLMVLDAMLVQHGELVARGSVLFLREVAASSPGGDTWSPEVPVAGHPSLSVIESADEGRLYFSTRVGWTAAATDHRNNDRKQVWQSPLKLLKDETPSGFQAAAIASDLVNVTTNLGSAGVEYINADVTLLLTRTPAPGAGIGVAATERVQGDGIVAGSSSIFDGDGVVGIASTTALLNNRRTPRGFG